jgi:hypothetical protein
MVHGLGNSRGSERAEIGCERPQCRVYPACKPLIVGRLDNSMNSATELVDEIGRLERLHLDPAVRSSAAELNELLADDFLEIGASGRLFDKADVLASLPQDPALDACLTDLVVRQLAPDVALATYRIRSRSAEGDRHSLRSSLWVRRSSRWQLRFHQGTPVRSTPGVSREQRLSGLLQV